MKKKEYDEYYVPDNLNIKLLTDNMNEIVNCSQCLKEVTYGSCFTSLEIHNHIGLGFPVCYECYREEWKRRGDYDIHGN